MELEAGNRTRAELGRTIQQARKKQHAENESVPPPTYHEAMSGPALGT